MGKELSPDEIRCFKVFLRHVERLFASPLATNPPTKVQRSVHVDCLTGQATHTWQGYDEERLLAQLPLLRQCLVKDEGTSFTKVCGLVIRKCPSLELQKLGLEVAKAWKQILHSKPHDWDAAFFGDRLTLHQELMDFFYGPSGLFHTEMKDDLPSDIRVRTPARLHLSLGNLFQLLGNAHWIVKAWLTQSGILQAVPDLTTSTNDALP